MKRNRSGAKKTATWGDWRPCNIAALAWSATQAIANNTPVNVEIAGQTVSAAAIPTVPFDPGLQLATGAVTLSEEETFSVQVKGHVDITLTGAALGSKGGVVEIQSGLYRSQYRAGAGFIVPDINSPQGIADVNWLNRRHMAVNFGNEVSGVTTVSRVSLPVSGTLLIRQGVALYWSLNLTFAQGGFSYTSYVEYRIRRNVD